LHALSCFVLLIAAGAAFALGTAPTRAVPERQTQDDRPAIFMPLALQDIYLSQIPYPLTAAPPTGTPTPTEPPTATPTDTPEPPTETPTPSPEPTSTPSPVKPSVVRGHLTLDGEPADEGLGDGTGPGLVLQSCASQSSCDIVQRVGVDAEGKFAFQDPPALAGDRFYRVAWINESDLESPFYGTSDWIGVWYTPPIREFGPGSEVDVGRIELANIPPTGPSHGTGYGGLPWTFTWRPRRSEIAGYQYHWVLDEAPCGSHAARRVFWKSPSVGQRGSYTVTSHPPGTRFGVDYKYCWYVWVEDGRGGHGETFNPWVLWWEP